LPTSMKGQATAGYSEKRETVLQSITGLI
jgi:hypothetical protein